MFGRELATAHLASFYILIPLPRKLTERREG